MTDDSQIDPAAGERPAAPAPRPFDEVEREAGRRPHTRLHDDRRSR